ncbi:hypothetical protein BC828DRAFT_406993 [Blastocladiella britannica]|nr:hypothetical protein BC828DRAFT_406993 [Blastocladiella britannica]
MARKSSVQSIVASTTSTIGTAFTPTHSEQSLPKPAVTPKQPMEQHLPVIPAPTKRTQPKMKMCPQYQQHVGLDQAYQAFIRQVVVQAGVSKRVHSATSRPSSSSPSSPSSSGDKSEKVGSWGTRAPSTETATAKTQQQMLGSAQMRSPSPLHHRARRSHV